MSKFRVAFDGKWQEDFRTLAEAVEWAQEVSRTGRMTWVVERRLLSMRLRAVFPEERAEEAREAWKQSHRSGFAGAVGGTPGPM